MGQKRKPVASNDGRDKSVKRSKPSLKPTGSNATPQAPNRQTYVFEPRPDWHAATLPELTSGSKSKASLSLPEKAVKLLQDENTRYEERLEKSSSENKFLSTIMTSGTLEDRISALTLLVQESPLHTMKAFDNLLGLARKKSRNQALMAVAALKDLLGQGVVLPERKLKALSKQPLDGATDMHLVVWAYEDWLKNKYFELLQILESWAGDEVAYARSRAITYVWELLKDKPEQEENLLRLLVNKLGDTDGKIASRASYLLLQLQTSHPAMKGVITSSISECLFRPGQSEHAKYYAVITLNQTVLSQKEEALASQLLEIYFSIFVQLLKKPEYKPAAATAFQGGGGKPGKMAAKKQKQAELAQDKVFEAGAQARDKLLSQVLTGVNRAVSFAEESSEFDRQIDLLFKITHSANFNTAVQALMLLQRITSSLKTNITSLERYYRTLYESLLDPRLANSNKQTLYLNLLYKSLKADVNAKRIQAFAKRLLQILCIHEPPFICSALHLISELGPRVMRMITEPEDEDQEEHFYDAPENGEKPVQNGVAVVNRYDPKKRDPTYANAGSTSLWDLLPTTGHYHPSVSVFADALCAGEGATLPPKPDPAAHTLLHFLDRFMYRNPKAAKESHGTSIMQPSAGSAAVDLLVKPSQAGAMQVNSEAFWQKKVEDVAPEDIFFHSYFNQAGSKRARSKKSEDADNDEDDSEAGEDEIWKAIASSRPEVEGLTEDDDVGFSDLEGYSDDEDESDGGIDLGGEDGDAFDLDGESEQESEGGIDLGGESGDEDIPELESDDGAMFDDEDDIPEDKDESKSSSKKKDRKKFKHLPTFASADDYAKLLADEPDDA